MYKKIPVIPFLFVSFIMICCSQTKEEPAQDSGNRTDTSEIVRTLIYGLWSLDSGNILANEGFYFQNDGTVNLVSAEVSGTWEVTDGKTLRITFPSLRNESVVYNLDSLSESKMILSGDKGTHLFRKVPFGINNEGYVSQGFSGSVAAGNEKEYFLNLPPAKKIALKLHSADSSVTFRLFDGKTELTSTGVRQWAAIVIRNDKYRVVVSKPKASSSTDSEYDLKVFVY